VRSQAERLWLADLDGELPVAGQLLQHDVLVEGSSSAASPTTLAIRIST
jgi:hypothetical protein